MNQIQKISFYLVWTFNFLLITFLFLPIITWGLIDWKPFNHLVAQGIFFQPIPTPAGLVNIAHLNLTPLSRSVGFLASVLSIIPSVLGMFILKKLFQNYEKGNIFSFENVQKYKYLGWLLFLQAFLVKPVSDMLLVLSATLSNPPGHRYITLTFGTLNLKVLFCGVLVIIISWIMAEGHKLQQEQSLTV